MFSGSIPALVTPFALDGALDEGALRSLVEWQIAEGSSALVACGTTGEAPTLDLDERLQVIHACVQQAKGRVPVIAGAGASDTRVALANLCAIEELGAQAALVMAPPYNRPSQEGIYHHFATLARATKIPILLYNVPARTASDIVPATLARLVAEFPETFVGIKDSSGLLERVSQQRAALGPDFCQLTGNDELALAFAALGGRGCVSVTANVAPRLCADLQAACAAGDYAKALKIHDRLYPLHAALFSDASPGPVKYALTRVRPGFPGALRLPMTWPGQESRDAVDAALEHAGLVERE